MIMERFNAKSIARAEQPLIATIPDEKREHTQKTIQTFLAPTLIGGKNDLSVRLTLVRVVAQFGAELKIIVNFAVEDDPESAIGIRHRLAAGWRKVDNAQAIVA